MFSALRALAKIDTFEAAEMLLGVLQAFQLSFDASSEIERSLMEAKDAAAFGMAKDPQLKARSGISKDLSIFAPFDPTNTIDGWTGMNGDTSRAALPAAGPDALALLQAAAPSVAGIGADRKVNPARGSNNWIVSGALTESGHAMLANAVPLFDQGVPDAGTAVGLSRLSVDHPNGRKERTRLARPGTLRP